MYGRSLCVFCKNASEIYDENVLTVTSLFNIGVSESNGNSLITCTFVAVVRVIENFLLVSFLSADQENQALYDQEALFGARSESMYLL